MICIFKDHLAVIKWTGEVERTQGGYRETTQETVTMMRDE